MSGCGSAPFTLCFRRGRRRRSDSEAVQDYDGYVCLQRRLDASNCDGAGIRGVESGHTQGPKSAKVDRAAISVTAALATKLHFSAPPPLASHWHETAYAHWLISLPAPVAAAAEDV